MRDYLPVELIRAGVGQEVTTTTWLGVLSVLIITIPSILGALAVIQTQRNRKKLGDVKSTVERVNDQVSNGHHTNLRDDLTEGLRLMRIVKTGVEKLQDEDIRLIRGDISRISNDIQTLRGELSVERNARTDLERRFGERECLRPESQ